MSEEPISMEEYVELEKTNLNLMGEVKEVEKLIEKNEMEKAIFKLDNLKSDCSICQSEIDDAKGKVKLIHTVCNIEKSASDEKCKRLSNFVINQLADFVNDLDDALTELKEEAESGENYVNEKEEEEEY